jgi:hypothetical protein
MRDLGELVHQVASDVVAKGLADIISEAPNNLLEVLGGLTARVPLIAELNVHNLLRGAL